MLILVLLGMYFEAAVVFVTKSSHFFKLAVAILCADRICRSLKSIIQLLLQEYIAKYHLIPFTIILCTVCGWTFFQDGYFVWKLSDSHLESLDMQPGEHQRI